MAATVHGSTGHELRTASSVLFMGKRVEPQRHRDTEKKKTERRENQRGKEGLTASLLLFLSRFFSALVFSVSLCLCGSLSGFTGGARRWGALGTQVRQKVGQRRHLRRLHLLAVGRHVAAARRAVADLVDQLVVGQTNDHLGQVGHALAAPPLQG